LWRHIKVHHICMKAWAANMLAWKAGKAHT
jgi:hypothetical protein